VVEDNDLERSRIVESIGDGDVRAVGVSTGEEALATLAAQEFDSVVVDLGLPDMAGIDLIERIKADPRTRDLPVIVYTGRDLTPSEQARLDVVAESVITKDARSMDRLLGETALFLHRVEEDLTPPVKEAVRRSSEPGSGLAGKAAMIVDDDVRNIFATTSMLERWGMVVRRAENGREAIEALRRDPAVDVVLMDIMMPEMDGYETTRAIRAMPEFAELPIVALTAKAMKDDRRKCLEAGASDYIAKPVQSDQLGSILRVLLVEGK
jgi:CheY-like chemotaxis protein